MKQNDKNKIFLVLFLIFTLFVIVFLGLEFRAYFYSESYLKELAQKSINQELKIRTKCEKLIFKSAKKSDKIREVKFYQWKCFNEKKDSYFIIVTIESDGFINIERLFLTKEELQKL